MAGEQQFLDYEGLTTFKGQLNGVNIVTATGDGAAYTATIPNVTTLKKGLIITIIPNQTSSATIPTLNLNGLGAKNIKQRLSINTSLTAEAATESWMVANKPVPLLFDGTQWVTITGRPSATAIHGAVPIENGGTGAKNAAAAIENLGAASMDYAKKVGAPWNIADNSDWSNPVNQRGKTVYDAGEQTIDRWYAAANGVSSVLQLNSGYIAMDTSTTTARWVTQRYEDNTLKAGESYTVAVWLLDGSVLVNNETIPLDSDFVDLYLSEKFQARLAHNSFDLLVWSNADSVISYKITHVGLFKGVYTAETISDYQPKGYSAELAECQRYLQRFRTSDLRKTYCEDFRPTMRMTPQGEVSHFEQDVNGTTYYFASAEL